MSPRRATSAGCPAWIAPRRSRRYAENSPAWPPSNAPLNSGTRWPASVWIDGARRWAFSMRMLATVLSQIRRLLGERRLPVVFERGGFNPRLFLRILEAGFDLLTYRKGRSARIPCRSFRSQQAVIGGQSVRDQLADQELRLLRGRPRLRQVTRLANDGHGTPILSSRRNLPAVHDAYRTF